MQTRKAGVICTALKQILNQKTKMFISTEQWFKMQLDMKL